MTTDQPDPVVNHPPTGNPEGLIERAELRTLGPEVPCSGCGWTWSRRFDPEVARRSAMCRQYHRGDGRTLGPAGTTDPRAGLIRTDPGRHAANRGPAFEADDLARRVTAGEISVNRARELAGMPVPGWPGPEVEDPPAARPATFRVPAELVHRCPEPDPSHEGWWFSVGVGVGVLLAGLFALVVTLW